MHIAESQCSFAVVALITVQTERQQPPTLDVAIVDNTPAGENVGGPVTRPTVASPEGGTESSLVPLVMTAEGCRRGIRCPYMMTRFLKVDTKSEPMPLYAKIGILEGNIREGEDMFARRRLEEGWNSILVEHSSSMDCEVETSSVDSGSRQQYGNKG